ncbi:PspA/IM30 family protein [Salmonella enterica]|nr:PspA/IM30 family protein [Salmonella enterica]
MSLKNLLKRIFTTVEANVTAGLDKLTDTEKRLNLAARKLSDEIRRLEEARVANVRNGVKLKKTAEENLGEAAKREQILKDAIARGSKPARSEALIVLHRRRIGEALLAQVKDIEASSGKLNEAIIQLGDKLDEVKSNLELVRVQKETSNMGLVLPEDIDYAAGMTTIDIDAILRETEIADSSYSANSPSSIEADNYLASLAAK